MILLIRCSVKPITYFIISTIHYCVVDCVSILKLIRLQLSYKSNNLQSCKKIWSKLSEKILKKDRKSLPKNSREIKTSEKIFEDKFGTSSFVRHSQSLSHRKAESAKKIQVN